MRTREEIINEWEKSEFPSTNLILEVALDCRDLLEVINKEQMMEDVE